MRQPQYEGGEEVFLLKDAAAMLGKSEKTVRAWLKKAGLAPGRGEDGRCLAIPHSTIVALARRHGIILRPIGPASSNGATSAADQAIPIAPREVQPTLKQVYDKLRDLEEQMVELRAIVHREPFVNTRLFEGSYFSRTADPPMHIGTVEAILERAITLISDLPPRVLSGNRDGEIVLCFQGEQDLLAQVGGEQQRRWYRALRKATGGQWQIVHLIRTSPDYVRTMHIVEQMIQLLGDLRSGYRPLHFTLDDLALAPADYIVVPEQAILKLARSTQARYIDTASEYPPGSAGYAEIAQRVYALREHARPVVTSYQPLSYDFNRAITQVESVVADRYLFMNGLSDLTVPGFIHHARAEELARRFPADPAKARQARGIAETRVRREDQFERVITQCHYYDMCPMGAVTRYVKTGEYAPNDWFRRQGCEPLSPKLRRMHLQWLIDRLRTYPNYELQLVPDMEVAPSLLRTYWLVKRDRTVLLECGVARANDPLSEVDLSITDPDVVQAFYMLSQRLWRASSDRHRNRQWVMRWLEQRLNEIT